MVSFAAYDNRQLWHRFAASFLERLQDLRELLLQDELVLPLRDREAWLVSPLPLQHGVEHTSDTPSR